MIPSHSHKVRSSLSGSGKIHRPRKTHRRGQPLHRTKKENLSFFILLTSFLLSIYTDTSAQQPQWFSVFPQGPDYSFQDIHFINADTGWVVSRGGPAQARAFRTTDGGQNWEKVIIDTIPPIVGYHFSVNFVSDAVGYITTLQDYLYMTKDGGQNWIQVDTNDDVIYYDSFFFNELEGFIVGGNVIFGPVTYAIQSIKHTNDGGYNWQYVYYDTLYNSVAQVSAIDFSNDSCGIAVGDHQFAIRTRDRGQTWERLWTIWDRNYADIIATGDSLFFTCGRDYVNDKGLILYTDNFGESWQEPQYGNYASFWGIDFVGKQTGWVCGYDGYFNAVIIKSADGGLTWQEENPGSGSGLVAIKMIDSTLGYACGAYSTILKYGIPTGISRLGDFSAIEEYNLFQNYPNPFNPVTIIKYQLPKTTKVRLEVYNILGQKVKTLVDGLQPADYYTIEWDGRNNHGKQVGSGLYIYRLIGEATDGSENFVKVRKMLLIR